MGRASNGTIALAIEIAFLGVGGYIYLGGFGAGPQAVASMVAGTTVAIIGLLVGGLLGVRCMMKNAGRALPAMAAVILPLVILAVVFVRRIGPL